MTDTGIGIPHDKLKIIFEPFQQADTGTSRKYGGTGPGPVDQPRDRPAARRRDPGPEHAGRGEHLHPLPAAGLPCRSSPRPAASPPEGRARPRPSTRDRDPGRRSPRPPRRRRLRQTDVGDHRDAIEPGDRVLLIIEHEPRFAAILVDKAHEMGFKALTTSPGESALELAHEFQPAAITLDLRLPDMDGWVVLDRLKHDPSTRHIPVHVISVDDNWSAGHEARGLRLSRSR